MPATTTIKATRLLVTACLLYAMTVALIVVPLLNGLAPTLFHQQTGRTLQFHNITFNPLTLELIIGGVRIDNPDGSPFIAFDQLAANLSVLSLWQGPTFDELQVDGLEINVAQTAPDRYNFSDIVDYRQRRTNNATPTTNALGIAIDRLTISAKAIQFNAAYLATPFATHIENVALHGTAITTRVDAAQDTPSALPALAALELQLALTRADIRLPRAPQPFATHVEKLQFGVTGFSTRTAQAQPFTFTTNDESGGKVQASGQLSLASAHSSGDLQIQQLSLLPIWRYLAPQLHFDLERGKASLNTQFEINWQSALRYHIDAATMRLDTVALQARNDTESRLDLGTLALSPLQIDNAQRRVHVGMANLDAVYKRGWNRGTRISLIDLITTNFPPSRTDSSKPWQLQIDELNLDNSRLDWRTDLISEEKLAVAPIKITAKNLHWPDAVPADFNLSATINGSVALALRGALTPATRSGSVDGDIRGLPLTWGNPYLEREIRAYINNGTLNSNWRMTLDHGQPQHIAAVGSIENFQLLRQSNHVQLAAWQHLRWQQLDIDTLSRNIALARVDMEKPQARFRIYADGTNNFQTLWIPAATHAPAPIAQLSRVNAPPNTVPSTPWQVAVAQIHMNAGELDFRDGSLPRPFRARIGDFSGDIKNLSSRRDTLARIDLQGSVDGYAPVSLTGTAALLRPQPAVDLALDFTNLDLATFTPYSGTYAGYSINRGLLTLQLAYRLDNNRLQGRNRVIINQLELGERVSSPKAVDLPLHLAIALLTDENGILDLDVDVSGNLDDPQFSVKGIIWKALRNMIVKAVTSPFRLLASLVGGNEENFGRIDFPAGTDTIDHAAREQLAKLTQALAKRPGLQVHVIGHSDTTHDANAMKQGILDELLDEEGVTEEDRNSRNLSWQRAIGELYAKTFPDRKAGTQTAEQQAVALRDNMTLGADAMPGLAARRALAVKRMLVVDLGLATDRVFIDATGANKDSAQSTQTELRIDN